MSQFRISENIVAAATVDGVPFIILVLLTVCVYNTRSYEVFNAYRDFKDQMDPYPWPGNNTFNNWVNDDIETILMATDVMLKSQNKI